MAEANVQPLMDLERVTRLMLEQAKCAAWGQVEVLEQERKDIVSCGLALGDPPLDPLQIQARLKKIIELDRQVMALARVRREELSMRISRFNQGRKANRAYHHNGSTR